MDQVELDGMPEAQEYYSAPPLVTPPRLRLNVEVRERDDDPELVSVAVEVRDGGGLLLALVTGTAPRDVEWSSAAEWIRPWWRWAFYESHSPF